MNTRIPTSGGKAGRGRNKTGTVQVVDGPWLLKQFRFTVSDPESLKKAVEKAKEWMKENK